MSPYFGWAIGLRAIAYDNELKSANGAASFGDICNMLQAEKEQQQQQEQQSRMDSSLKLVASEPEFECNAREQISGRAVPSLFLSMLSYIPNFSTIMSIVKSFLPVPFLGFHSQQPFTRGRIIEKAALTVSTRSHLPSMMSLNESIWRVMTFT